MPLERHPFLWLEHISDSDIKHGLVQITYELVFQFKVEYQLVGNVRFDTSTNIYS